MLVVLALCAGCAKESPLPTIEAEDSMTLASLHMPEREPMQSRFTCDGADVSPPLEWTEVPDAGEYVLTVIDVTARHDLFVHWIVWGIPQSTTRLAEGTLPDGAVEGTNDFGDVGYGGPCPPEGDEDHRYVFTVYAVEEGATDDLEEGAPAQELLEAISCCTLALGAFNADYVRP